VGPAWKYALVVKPEGIWSAIRYVVDRQGEPMAVFEAIEP
jgi:hypothetical protein